MQLFQVLRSTYLPKHTVHHYLGVFALLAAGTSKDASNASDA